MGRRKLKPSQSPAHKYNSAGLNSDGPSHRFPGALRGLVIAAIISLPFWALLVYYIVRSK